MVTSEVFLCLNFLFSPTPQLFAAVKIIFIIFKYFAEEKELKPFSQKDVAPSLFFFFYNPPGSIVRPSFLLNITITREGLKHLPRSFYNSDSVSSPSK